MLTTKFVKAGRWRTVEIMWNRAAIAYFQAPQGGRIRLRVGAGWFAYTRQTQSLNGIDCKKLKVSQAESVGYSRFQIKVPFDMDVTYDNYPGYTEEPTPQLPCS